MYYSPVRHSSSEEDSFDLHVLGTPPAFILSQDRTLRSDGPRGAPLMLFGPTRPMTLIDLGFAKLESFGVP